MTYCLGYWLEKGLVLASDSRTNAGVDYISTYSKMHVFQPAADRLFVLLAAGNLATTQAVLNRIQRDLHERETTAADLPPRATPTLISAFSPERGSGPETAPLQSTLAADALAEAPPPATPAAARAAAAPDLLSARYLFEAADYVGRISVAVQEQFAAQMRQSGGSAQASFILGGQIRGEEHGLFLVYPQGNAVKATRDTPFLQIGESKYGKPPLDVVGHCGLSLEDAARLCLISQVITRRSNLTVGPPFEIALVPANELRVSHRLKLDKDDSQVNKSMEIWARSMQETLAKLPRFPWEEDPL